MFEYICFVFLHSRSSEARILQLFGRDEAIARTDTNRLKSRGKKSPLPRQKTTEIGSALIGGMKKKKTLK